MNGDVLRQIMMEKGINQSTLSEKTKIKPSNICDLCNRKTNPTEETLKRLASALDVSINDLTKEE